MIKRSYGWQYAFLKAGGKLPSVLSGWNVTTENDCAEKIHFPEAERNYARIDRQKIFTDIDVNSTDGIDFVKNLKPDVVINLGGIIYRRELIHSCRLFLNYHSGISPIYNGAGTINFAFANGHPHLCGGTLMTMSPVIDGGMILAHYLPSIAEADTPASLSMKTYAGAALLYDRFLSNLAEDRNFSGASQKGPLFYVRGAHWTLYQTLMSRHHLRFGIVKQHLRDEKTIEYWKATDSKEAEDLLNKTLSQLMWGQA